MEIPQFSIIHVSPFPYFSLKIWRKNPLLSFSYDFFLIRSFKRLKSWRTWKDSFKSTIFLHIKKLSICRFRFSKGDYNNRCIFSNEIPSYLAYMKARCLHTYTIFALSKFPNVVFSSKGKFLFFLSVVCCYFPLLILSSRNHDLCALIPNI